VTEIGRREWGMGSPESTASGGPERRVDSPLPIPNAQVYREFEKRRDGMIHAMEGGLWLHRHVWKGHPMAHLVSVDRDLLLAYGDAVGLPERRLQYKPLKDPRTGERREAWHWDLVGEYLPDR
jgi:hypothetical protein